MQSGGSGTGAFTAEKRLPRKEAIRYITEEPETPTRKQRPVQPSFKPHGARVGDESSKALKSLDTWHKTRRSTTKSSQTPQFGPGLTVPNDGQPSLDIDDSDRIEPSGAQAIFHGRVPRKTPAKDTNKNDGGESIGKEGASTIIEDEELSGDTTISDIDELSEAPTSAAKQPAPRKAPAKIMNQNYRGEAISKAKASIIPKIGQSSGNTILSDLDELSSEAPTPAQKRAPRKTPAKTQNDGQEAIVKAKASTIPKFGQSFGNTTISDLDELSFEAPTPAQKRPAPRKTPTKTQNDGREVKTPTIPKHGQSNINTTLSSAADELSAAPAPATAQKRLPRRASAKSILQTENYFKSASAWNSDAAEDVEDVESPAKSTPKKTVGGDGESLGNEQKPVSKKRGSAKKNAGSDEDYVGPRKRRRRV